MTRPLYNSSLFLSRSSFYVVPYPTSPGSLSLHSLLKLTTTVNPLLNVLPCFVGRPSHRPSSRKDRLPCRSRLRDIHTGGSRLVYDLRPLNLLFRFLVSILSDTGNDTSFVYPKRLFFTYPTSTKFRSRWLIASLYCISPKTQQKSRQGEMKFDT